MRNSQEISAENLEKQFSQSSVEDVEEGGDDKNPEALSDDDRAEEEVTTSIPTEQKADKNMPLILQYLFPLRDTSVSFSPRSIEDLNTAMDEIRAKITKASKQAKEDVAELNFEKGLLRLELSVAKGRELESLTPQLDDLNGKISQSKEEIEARKKRIASLSKQDKNIKKQLQNEIKEFEGQIKTLQKSKSGLDDQAKKLNKEIKSLHEDARDSFGNACDSAKKMKSPDLSKYRIAKANVYYHLLRIPKDAEHSYEILVKKLDVQDQVVFQKYADTLAIQGKHGEAVNYYQTVAEKDPTNWRAIYQLGTSRDRIGLFADARKSYNEVLRLNSTYVPSQNAIGNSFRREGNHQQALEAYEAAILMNASYSIAHYNKAVHLQDANLLLHSLSAFDLALKSQIDNSPEMYQSAHTQASVIEAELSAWEQAGIDRDNDALRNAFKEFWNVNVWKQVKGAIGETTEKVLVGVEVTGGKGKVSTSWTGSAQVKTKTKTKNQYETQITDPVGHVIKVQEKCQTVRDIIRAIACYPQAMLQNPARAKALALSIGGQAGAAHGSDFAKVLERLVDVALQSPQVIAENLFTRKVEQPYYCVQNTEYVSPDIAPRITLGYR